MSRHLNDNQIEGLAKLAREYSSFSEAFKAGREAHGGGGGTFTWKGKKYSTDTAEDLNRRRGEGTAGRVSQLTKIRDSAGTNTGLKRTAQNVINYELGNKKRHGSPAPKFRSYETDSSVNTNIPEIKKRSMTAPRQRRKSRFKRQSL